MSALTHSVIPAQAGIQFAGQASLKINQMNNLDSRLCGNDGHVDGSFQIIDGF